jgi:hypothetical protein
MAARLRKHTVAVPRSANALYVSDVSYREGCVRIVAPPCKIYTLNAYGVSYREG